MNARWLAILCLGALPAFGQDHGFAGLGGSAGRFALPEPGRVLAFPGDHGPHDGFRIEWWYLTANLRGGDGRDYGAQWTLFRSALAPEGADAGWSSPQVWMAHAALTTPDSHHVAERLGRGGIGQAVAQAVLEAGAKVVATDTPQALDAIPQAPAIDWRPLDVRDGAVRWTQQEATGVQATPLAAGGTLYVAFMDGTLRAYRQQVPEALPGA